MLSGSAQPSGVKKETPPPGSSSEKQPPQCPQGDPQAEESARSRASAPHGY